MDKISIIVPVYNCENYIKRCIESALKQTYKNIELILIDDGSTDGVGIILDNYKKLDNRVTVIHQKNRGESNARNVGLSVASGDYIGFMDCDDWIEPDMYKTLHNEIRYYDVDMVASGWYRDTDNECDEIKNILPVNESTFGRDELLKYIYMRDSYRAFAYMWNKLYKRELLERGDGTYIKFNEDLRLGGDVLFLAEVASNVKKAKFINKAFYHYYQRDTSGCHTKNLDKMLDWIRSYEKVIELFENQCIDNKIIDYVKRFLAYHSYNAAKMAIDQGKNKEKLLFQGFMKKHQFEYEALNKDIPERILQYNKILLL